MDSIISHYLNHNIKNIQIRKIKEDDQRKISNLTMYSSTKYMMNVI